MRFQIYSLYPKADGLPHILGVNIGILDPQEEGRRWNLVTQELVSMGRNTYSCVYIKCEIKKKKFSLCSLEFLLRLVSLQNSSQVRSPERRKISFRKKSRADFCLFLPRQGLCRMLCVLSLLIPVLGGRFSQPHSTDLEAEAVPMQGACSRWHLLWDMVPQAPPAPAWGLRSSRINM